MRPVEVCLRGGYGHIGRVMTRAFAARGEAFRLPYDLRTQLGTTTKADVFDSLRFLIVGNRLGSAQMVADAIEIDSVHGRLDVPIEVRGEANPGQPFRQVINIDGVDFAYAQAPDLKSIPWQVPGALRVLVDCTGKVKEPADVPAALRANNPRGGADIVLATTTLKGGDNYVVGLPKELELNALLSAILRGEGVGPKAGFGSGSCTTNASLPPIEALSDLLSVDYLLYLTTIHAITSSQSLQDAPHPEAVERGRAAGFNIVPTSTNAKELGSVSPGSYGQILSALAFRVPTPDGSIVTQILACRPKGDRTTPLTAMEVNMAIEAATRQPRFAGVLGYVPENKVRVSADFLRDPHSSVVDGRLTAVSPFPRLGESAFVLNLHAWYANEFGGVPHRCGDIVLRAASLAMLQERPIEVAGG